MLVGSLMALWGLNGLVAGVRRAVRGNSSRLTSWIQGFRLFIIGLAIVGIGAAWWWHLLWILVISLAIGGEEVLESSVVIYALKRGERTERGTTSV